MPVKRNCEKSSDFSYPFLRRVRKTSRSEFETWVLLDGALILTKLHFLSKTTMVGPQFIHL